MSLSSSTFVPFAPNAEVYPMARTGADGIWISRFDTSVHGDKYYNAAQVRGGRLDDLYPADFFVVDSAHSLGQGDQGLHSSGVDHP